MRLRRPRANRPARRPDYDKARKRLAVRPLAEVYDYADDYSGRLWRELEDHRRDPASRDLSEARVHLAVLEAIVDEIDSRG